MPAADAPWGPVEAPGGSSPSVRTSRPCGAGLLSLEQDAAKRTRGAGQRLQGLVRQLGREESIATKLCWRLVDIAPGELG